MRFYFGDKYSQGWYIDTSIALLNTNEWYFIAATADYLTGVYGVTIYKFTAFKTQLFALTKTVTAMT